ncbi:conserved hypothetical protein [Paraburkholderia unamae]|uniref:hypothetical protein n=1 Tax=Paraburkholderia unamae TaxID=219649 RepID=UPI001CAC9A31|nr:hypothetical protein [Paraburkholderia unamae]CAG9255580.1 conserved hypothetical protein [Paraburkholderia unamae]
MTRKLFIHCGLHKTATTALQSALSQHSDQLRDLGLLYPRAGQVTEDVTGHHNIAWELARDRRFTRQLGTLETLLGEIEYFDGDIILSSEDFEGLLVQPARWEALLRLASQCSLTPVALVYLRNQASYLESLYPEMLKHRFGEELPVWLEDTLGRGSIQMKEWIFHFDYLKIADAMSEIRELDVIFRNYHVLSDETIITDFFEAINAPRPPFIKEQRVNQRDSLLDSLNHFYKNRVERPLRDSEVKAIIQICSHIPQPPQISMDLRDKMEERFFQSNNKICDAWGLERSGLNDFSTRNAISKVAPIERIFTFETQIAILSIAAAIENGVRGNIPETDPERTKLLRGWLDWVYAD